MFVSGGLDDYFCNNCNIRGWYRYWVLYRLHRYLFGNKTRLTNLLICGIVIYLHKLEGNEMTTKQQKEFPKFEVGDTVRKMEFGPNAEPRKVEAVGIANHVYGYVQVSGLLGWHSARRFEKCTP